MTLTDFNVESIVGISFCYGGNYDDLFYVMNARASVEECFVLIKHVSVVVITQIPGGNCSGGGTVVAGSLLFAFFCGRSLPVPGACLHRLLRATRGTTFFSVIKFFSYAFFCI